MMWLQRPHIPWMKEGDRTTSYFHQHAVWTAYKNKIKKLKTEEGDWCDNQWQGRKALDFFSGLCTLSIQKWFQVSCELIDLIDTRISDNMNVELCRDFTAEEISNALLRMGPLKAPGLNGFPMFFFQNHWDLMRENVVAAVQNSSLMGTFQLVSRTQLLFSFPRSRIQKKKISYQSVCVT